MSKTAPIFNGNGDFLNSGLLDIFSPFFYVSDLSDFPGDPLALSVAKIKSVDKGKAFALFDGVRLLR
jgi:hypothetical protein